MAEWTFITNHGTVLACVARDPGIRLREIAASTGITERAVHKIVSDLVEAGYLKRTREGNRNRYEVQVSGPLRHPLFEHRSVGELLAVLVEETPTSDAREPSRRLSLQPS